MPDKENKLIADILEVFRSNPDRRYKSEQIEDILRMHGASAFKRVVKALAVLEGESKISLTNKDEFKMASPETVVEGTFKVMIKVLVSLDMTKLNLMLLLPELTQCLQSTETQLK
jgi:hypothetical protein